MLIAILNKLMCLVFIMSCLNIFRHGYYFVQAFFTSTEETPIKYVLKPLSLYLLGISISYVITVIFTGIGL